MASNDQPADGDGNRAAAATPKRPWVAPKLETFGTIADLTRGASGKKFDGGHPPGKSKSRI
jgi:hypothetical protein